MLESKPRADRWFFGLAGLWFVALTLVGFSPTFYWRSNPVPLPFHLIIHGVLYSTWILVLVAGILGLEAVRPFRKVLAAWPGIAVVVYDALSLGRVPILSASLLALVWLVTWFTISDFLFQRPAGEALIHALTRIVVW